MGSAIGLGLALGGLNAAGSLLNGIGQQQRENAQRKQQAQAAEAQAAEYRRQENLARQRGNIEAANVERRKSQLRREYQDTQSRNRVMLGAGNVDASSGSALDLSLGNIDRFAMDLGENAYDKALKQWEANENAKNLDYQARSADAQASYLRQTQNNLAGSLFSSLLTGANGFVSGYTMAGGRFGKDPVKPDEPKAVWV